MVKTILPVILMMREETAIPTGTGMAIPRRRKNRLGSILNFDRPPKPRTKLYQALFKSMVTE